MVDVKRVIEVALAEEGYIEKASDADLDSKTGNPGDANYTKYWRDVCPKLNGHGWCDCFVKWCFQTAYGKETAEEMLYCNKGFVFTVSGSADYFKNVGQWFNTPQVGDQIFFKSGSAMVHTGLVYNVDSLNVYTIEGNTGAGSGVIANGGGVARRRYPLNYALIAGYGRPNYAGTIQNNSKPVVEEAKPVVSTAKASVSNNKLKELTKKYIKQFAEAMGLNKNASANNIFENSLTVSTRTNTNHKVVTILERYFTDLGFYTGEIEADLGKKPIYGGGMAAAVKRYQKEIVLAEPKYQDGYLSRRGATWKKILGLS